MYLKSAQVTSTQLLTLVALLLFTSQSLLAQQHALKIKLAGNGYSDETVVRYIPQATNAFDPAYDAWKLFSANPNVPSIYTADSASSYAINSKPIPSSDLNEKLLLLIPDSGVYTLDFTELFAFDSTTLLVMEDLATNHFQNIRLNPNYQFTVQGSSFPMALNHRFKFHLLLAPAINVTQPVCKGEKGVLQFSKPGSSAMDYTLSRQGNTVVNGTTVSSTSVLSDLLPGNYTLQLHYFAGIAHQFTIDIAEGQTINVAVELLFDGNRALSGTPIQFKNLTHNASESQWDFGDGLTSNEKDTYHTYHTPDQYKVVLHTSDGPCNATYEQTIEVEALTSILEYNKKEATISYNQREIQVNSVGSGKYIHKVILFSLSGKTLMESESGLSRDLLSLSVPETHSGLFVCTVFWSDNTVKSEKLYIQ